MAKKVVVAASNSKSKPKRRVCLTCLLVLVIFGLVIFAGLFGAGWYFGDIYSKQYFDMSLKEVFGVTNGLYWANDKKVVKNGFTDDDRNGFYNEIKTNMLLRTDVDIDFDGELTRAIGLVLSQNSGSTAASVERLNDDGDNPNDWETDNPDNPDNPDDADGSDDGDDSSGDGGIGDVMSILTNLAAGVFTRDNIDIELLKSYSEENDNYIFNLKDKQLAAFVDFMLKQILSGEGDASLIPQAVNDYVPLKDVVALKEITFGTQTVTSELGESVLSATSADITIWIGLQNAAGQALTKLVTDAGWSWTSPLVRLASNILLPKNLYVTVSLPLEENAETIISYNGIGKTKRDNFYKLTDGVMGLMGAGTLEELIKTNVTDTIKPFIVKVTQNMDLTSASSGTIKLDLIDTLVKYASPEITSEDPLTKADFMYMLQALLTSSADARLEELRPYLYDEWYESGTGALVYNPDDKTGYTHIDYEREFIKEIENKYCVYFGENARLSDVLEMLGISLDGSANTGKSQELLDIVDAAKFKASLEKNIDELKLNVTDRMLAAGMSPQLDKAFESGSLSSLKLKLDALTFVSKEGKSGTYALLAVDIDVSEVLGSLGGNVVGALALNILPEKILISMTVDITQNPEGGYVYDAVEFGFNDFDKTSNVLDTLKKLVPSLNVQYMAEQVESMLRGMVQSLDEKLGVELVPSVTAGGETSSGKIVMPNIYKVITELALKDEATGETVVTDSELKDVLRGLNDTSGINNTVNIAADNKEFIDQITDKYYLNPAVRLESFSDVTDFLSGDFSASKFRLGGDDPEVKYLVYDDRSVAELAPEITNAQLGALIKTNMTGDVGNYEILSIGIHPTSLDILLRIEVGKLMPDKFKSIIDSEFAFVTAQVDMSADNGHDYPVTLRLNNMDSTQFENMLKIARLFDAGFDIDAQVSELGAIMYSQMNNLKTSLGGDDYVTFDEGKIKIASFYKFLASKMNITSASEDAVKKAVQGMYAKTSVFTGNDNNYTASDFLTNIGETNGFDEAELLSGITDIRFNAFFARMIHDSISQDGSVEAVQTIALAAGYTNGKTGDARTWANDKLKTSPTDTVIADDKDYILVTFRMNLNKDAVTGSQSFMPTSVYVTLALEKTVVDGKSRFENRGVIFNDMDAETYGVLCQIMSLDSSATDEDKINIPGITSQSLHDLNSLGSLGSIVFEQSTSDGIGFIKKGE